MIDPFSALVGVLLSIAALSLWIEFLDRWRGDRGYCAEMLRVRSTVTSAIKSGLDDADVDMSTSHNVWTKSTISRPPGWTSADEMRLVREIFLGSTQCSSSEQR